MEIRILGCSGGVGVDLRTTTLLIDQDILIDAGTGVGDLSMEEMLKIRHIFVTHSHLDHIACIPLLVDTLFDQLETPITIHAQTATLNALKDHIFNNVIWPDFSKLPNKENAVMRYSPMLPGEILNIGDRHLEMINVNHIVPGVGYRVENAIGVFAFSGDTTTNDTLWETLNQRDKLDVLIVETAFANADIDLCRRAGHYCADLLAADLAKLKHQPAVYISHNKPGAEKLIMAECEQAIKTHKIHPLHGGVRIKL
ncbi:CAMP phosphodiesterases class-II:Metallo-beta-lactamase superfamily [hydrothermal vent metagenome]|uniref:cAMP phosphodiesterases class-II:Metallo-beta-lactamase superfamily n=1 Tax=hydrothermal vent metagenome TaxID=652676 RepID=A0A3B1A5H1_9ZZZZ